MTERPNRTNQLKRFPPSPIKKTIRTHRPFWLPASNFYILAAALALAFFFLAWGVLSEGGDESPWIPAGIGASFVLIGAVFLREIVLRKARDRYLLIQKRLDYNLDNAVFHTKPATSEKKLSLEKNAEIVRQIQKKSDAAKILMKLPEGHFEVFELCREYLEINRRELQTVGTGSPRLAALSRTRQIVKDLQKFHLLTWAEIESRELTKTAGNRITITDKTENAQKALDVIRLALQHYPNEQRLIESEKVIEDFITSVRVNHFIEQGERSAFKGNNKRAVSHYKDALFILAREKKKSAEIDALAEKINLEIRKILEISAERKNLGNKKVNE